jgi:hypothetical protein
MSQNCLFLSNIDILQNIKTTSLYQLVFMFCVYVYDNDIYVYYINIYFLHGNLNHCHAILVINM